MRSLSAWLAEMPCRRHCKKRFRLLQQTSP